MDSALPASVDFLVSSPMEPSQWIARRATLDDLPALEALWQRCGLPWEQLEKYLTEFQVILNEDGGALGALGLLVDGHEGLVHTEAIPPGQDAADDLRAALWKRLQIVARNQGVLRLWTQEDAPYWGTVGFGGPDGKVRSEAKSAFLDSDPDWRFFQLADPDRAAKLVQEQLAVWEATRSQEADSFQQTIQNIRNSAFIITGAIIVILFAMALYVFVRRPELVQRLLRH